MTTITDVARVAQVSTATVSRVLNGNPEVNPALAERVQAAVDQLGYRPSRLARSLRTKRTAVLAVIIPDIRNPFFTDMVRGVEDVAYASGYSLMLCNADEDTSKEAEYLQLSLTEHMAGVILTPASRTGTDVRALTTAGVPVVTVDRRLDGHRVDSVLVDNAAGAAMAVEHLASMGYRRIGCISGPSQTSTAADRLAGYRAGLRACGIRPSARLISTGDFREAGGKVAMQRLLALSRPPDAVFATNNLMTLGALEAIAEAGMRIPGDIAVVGFDDVPWASLLRPALTTVAQPIYQAGTEVTRMLLERIDGFRGSGRERVLTPALRIRDSSAARRTLSAKRTPTA